MMLLLLLNLLLVVPVMECLTLGENLSHYDLYAEARQMDKAKDSNIAAAADASDEEKNLTGALLVRS